MDTSKVIGIMLLHTDEDKEYYEPHFSDEDIDAIYEILEKYGDNNESVRGNLKVVDQPVALHFADDWEKMRDFRVLPKKEFLASYSYLTEEEYELTLIEVIKRIVLKATKDNI